MTVFSVFQKKPGFRVKLTRHIFQNIISWNSSSHHTNKPVFSIWQKTLKSELEAPFECLTMMLNLTYCFLLCIQEVSTTNARPLQLCSDYTHFTRCPLQSTVKQRLFRIQSPKVRVSKSLFFSELNAKTSILLAL